MFHALFWTYWLVMPFLSPDEDERHRQYMLRLIPVMLTNIPLFFLNTEWLVPRILRKHGVPAYLLSVVTLAFSFFLLQGVIKGMLFHKPVLISPREYMPIVFSVLFVTAVSTGYGLVSFLISEERSRQAQQQERMQSELSFLRSQISPHFIFNVLNSIIYLIRSKSALAEAVTFKLSELMRYMLYESGDAHIPLAKEISYLKNYIELQKIRFEEDVDIRLSIEGDAAVQMIEPMLMIPFVENAFKHGIGMVHQPLIDIRLDIHPDDLHFYIRNKISGDPAEGKDNSSGIGLRNVKRRLELLYPDAYRLDIQEGSEWFEVTLYLRFSYAGRPG